MNNAFFIHNLAKPKFYLATPLNATRHPSFHLPIRNVVVNLITSHAREMGKSGKMALGLCPFLMQIVNSYLYFVVTDFFFLCQLLFFCLLAKLKAKQLHSYA